MDAVRIHLNGDGCWPDLETKSFEHGVLHEVAYLLGGMVRGNGSVSMRITLDDGRIVIAETSARMFVTVAAAIKGRAQHHGMDT